MRRFLGLLWCRLLAVARAQAAIPVIPGSAKLIPVSGALNSRLAALREFAFNLLSYLEVFGAKTSSQGANRKNSRLNSRQTGKTRTGAAPHPDPLPASGAREELDKPCWVEQPKPSADMIISIADCR